jgi:hypothetical protein
MSRSAPDPLTGRPAYSWPQQSPPEAGELAGEGSNLQHPAPKAGVLPIELPATDDRGGTTLQGACFGEPATTPSPHGAWRPAPANLPCAMGSLIKKRRKRMRKKKHKKMLKATRWQRRAGK